MTRRTLDAACLLVAIGGSFALALSAHSAGDWPTQVRPAVDALLAGDLGRFAEQQPAYGSLAALVQAPLVALAPGGGDLAAFRLASLAGLLPLALLGVVLARRMADRGQPPVACLAACALVLVNPATSSAISNGHPEDLLAAALAIGAVLAAGRRSWLVAALLLGLAVSTKQWALLAVPAALIAAAPRRRVPIALAAAAVAAAFTLPLALADAQRFAHNTRANQGGALIVSRFSAWWPLGHDETRAVEAAGETHAVTVRRGPGGLTGLGRPLALVLAAALGLAAALARRRGTSDALALLALTLLLRCVLDPLTALYYYVPFLVALLAWETNRYLGLPVMTLLASAGLWAVFEALVHQPALDNALYLGSTVALAAWIALALFGTGREGRATAARGLRRRSRPGVPAGPHPTGA